MITITMNRGDKQQELGYRVSGVDLERVIGDALREYVRVHKAGPTYVLVEVK